MTGLRASDDSDRARVLVEKPDEYLLGLRVCVADDILLLSYLF